jgi:hypothetical protein
MCSRAASSNRGSRFGEPDYSGFLPAPSPMCDLIHTTLAKNAIISIKDFREASMSLESGEVWDGRGVFISYRRLDNDPPPDDPNDRNGFVDYLLRQVKYDLIQLGVTNAIFWQDRSKIAPSDDFSEEISNALNKADLFVAILSRNYITSNWCEKELHTMTARVEMFGAPAGKGRIFRVDKHKVPENEIPEALRRIESVQFYREDPYADCVDDYFWRGKVRFIKEYEDAVKKLALSISKRLEALGIPLQPKPERRADNDQPELRLDNACPSNGRVVFVATPAGDMVPYYRTLVTELRGAGYHVTPDPDKDLSKLGEEVRSAVVKALAEAEASIHLLGTRTGGRPDGLDMDLVPMQLAAAAEEVKKKTGFERLIWAPTVLPAGTCAEAEIAHRDPLEVLDRFGQRLLDPDQIVGATASGFNEFVLQRLGKKHTDSSSERKIVYIRVLGRNRKSAVKIAQELKRVGFDPILNPPPPLTKDWFARVEQGLFGRAQHVIIFWGSQSQAKILGEIGEVAAIRSRKPEQLTGGK